MPRPQRIEYENTFYHVIQGVDEDILRYYQRGNLPSIIGEKDFRAWVYDDLLPELEAEEKGPIIQPAISMGLIVKGVAGCFNTKPEELTRVIKGPQKGSEGRKIAMYLCQEMANVKLKDIAKYFNLSHIGSVSFITHQIRKRKSVDIRLARKINTIIENIMKQAD